MAQLPKIKGVCVSTCEDIGVLASKMDMEIRVVRGEMFGASQGQVGLPASQGFTLALAAGRAGLGGVTGINCACCLLR